MTTHARIPATAPSLTQRPAFVLPRFELPPPAVAGSPPPVPVLPSPQPCRAPAPPATTMLEQVQADSPAETAAAAASALHAPATQLRAAVSKLPAITLSFWVLKMAATTLGETGGDQISESMHVGYLATFALFMAIFLAAVTTQVRSGQLRPGLFWTVIVATSAAGTEMADFLFETIGIGVISGAMALIAPIVLIVLLGRTTGGSFSVTDITTRRDEVLYWATILTTNTIGTGLGDGLTAGIGVVGGTLVASSLMAVIIWMYFRTEVSRVALFWAAFIMTRPLGATGGDLLWEPRVDGGFGLGRVTVSLVLALFIAVGVTWTSRDHRVRAGSGAPATVG